MGKQIGFIGLGIMGKPMALNLLKAGHALTVHNRSRASVQELVAAGAADGKSSRGVAERSEIVITMLPDSPDVELVALGPDGVLEGARPGTVLIDMSTISPQVSQKVAAEAAKKGVEMLDAPVSGGDVGAKQGTLSIMVGGKQEVFDRCLEVFQAMGKNIVRVGEIGAGGAVKLANQVIVAGTIQAVAEGLVLGAKAGVDPELMVRAISGGLARCGILEVRAPRVLDGIFDPGFTVKLHLKDLGLALTAGKALSVPLPMTSYINEMFKALVAQGKGDRDHSSLIQVVEQMAGTEVRKRKPT
jgi:2-hydroxy-3-oxopropionate reductase